MNLERCVSCNSLFTPLIKHVIAYVNGKSIHSKFCKVCTKKHWEEFAKNHPDLMKSLVGDKK